MNTDILIAGSGCSGLYCALNLPEDKKITIITKSDACSNDSFLAQGGMCMLRSEDDYDSYFEDTMKAGHYENDQKSVEIMIKSSPELVEELLSYGVDFQKEKDGSLAFTKEGAHSHKRIVYHEDITGKEITSKLLEKAKQQDNITIVENTTLLDIIEKNNKCYGAVILTAEGEIVKVKTENVILATGGVGGLYENSTNFKHLTGDGVAMALRHGVEVKNVDYVQIHPTTLYSEKSEDRSFLISESVRGEGAKLYNKNGERFVDELLPRDLLTQEINKQMQIDGTKFVWEDLRTIPEAELKSHFPNIIEHCAKKGYDVFKECIPVVPAQHYFMGGVKVDYNSKTTMDNLYAVGETACNGVHGRNRLASNSLLESLVFAKKAALNIVATANKRTADGDKIVDQVDISIYNDIDKFNLENKELVWQEIQKRQTATKSA